MRITLNGQSKEINGKISLKVLVDQFCPNPKRIIAEVNEEVVKKPFWDDKSIQEGDHIELVTLVGGG